MRDWWPLVFIFWATQHTEGNILHETSLSYILLRICAHTNVIVVICIVYALVYTVFGRF